MIRCVNQSAPHRRPRSVRVVLCLLLLLPAAFASGHPRGEEPAVDEERLYRLQAAFVYNFLKYVQWPDDAFSHPEEPYAVCVVGSSDFAHIMAHTVDERTAQDRDIAVHDIRSVYAVSPQYLRRCHALYAAPTDSAEHDALFQRLRRSPVLTVGEGRSFVENGGVIAFGVEDRKLVLYINRNAAHRAQLTVSAKLLKRAELVAEREEAAP